MTKTCAIIQGNLRTDHINEIVTLSGHFVKQIKLKQQSKQMEQGARKRSDKPNIFAVLKPYKLMIFGLISFALLSNAANLVIPKLISHSIDDFSKGIFLYQKIILEFLAVAFIVFLFSFIFWY